MVRIGEEIHRFEKLDLKIEPVEGSSNEIDSGDHPKPTDLANSDLEQFAMEQRLHLN